MEEVAAVIYSYYRIPGYIYLHLPMRLTKECGITSGSRFNIFIKDEKLIIEQIKEEPCRLVGR